MPYLVPIKKRLAAPITLLIAVVGLYWSFERLQEWLMLPHAPLSVRSFHQQQPPFDGDFAAIEAHLAAIYVSDEQKMQVTPEFEKKLSMTTSAALKVNGGRLEPESFPKGLSGLIQKSFAGKNGRALAQLAECFYYYKQAETQWLNESTETQDSQKLANLAGLQAHYFGQPLSQDLFAEYHQLYRLMNGDKTTEYIHYEALPALHREACAPIATAFSH